MRIGNDGFAFDKNSTITPMDLIKTNFEQKVTEYFKPFGVRIKPDNFEWLGDSIRFRYWERFPIPLYESLQEIYPNMFEIIVDEDDETGLEKVKYKFE